VALPQERGKTMPENRLDILSGVPAIAEYVYGAATPYYVRRCRHLLANGHLPSKKVAGRVESRRSWLDAAWSEPDRLNAA
jgi:hypothetical protein